MNIRHEIDAELVKAQINKKIADHERHRIYMKEQALKTLESYEKAKLEGTTHLWSRVPDGGLHIDGMVDKWIQHELEYYSKVRIIELPQKGKRFILVYGDTNDATVTNGTGPTESIEKSAQWFLNGGR